MHATDHLGDDLGGGYSGAGLRMARDRSLERDPYVAGHVALAQAVRPADAHAGAVVEPHHRRHLDHLANAQRLRVDEEEDVGELEADPHATLP